MKPSAMNEPATKQDLLNLEDKFDINLVKRLDASFDAFRKEINYMFQIQDERWNRRFAAFESRIVSVIDPILREIETKQEDREIATDQIKQVKSDVTDLQKRVTKLELADK